MRPARWLAARRKGRRGASTTSITSATSRAVQPAAWLLVAGLAATVVTGTGAAAATDPRPAPPGTVGAASVGGGAEAPTVDLFYQAYDDRSLVRKNGATVESLGGSLTSGVAAVSAAPAGSVAKAAYVRGTDRAVWYREFSDGQWSPWRTLGGRAAGAPGATWTGDGTADPLVYVKGVDGALWRSRPGGWTSLSGRLTSDPAGLAPVAGRLPAVEDVFAMGGDGAVWEWVAGSWRRVSGQSIVAPTATLLPDGSTALCVRGPDNAIWVAYRPARADLFGPFHRVGGIFASAPTAVIDTRAPATLTVYGLGADGDVWAAREVLGGAEAWTLAEVP
jgi:hypothetical protein